MCIYDSDANTTTTEAAAKDDKVDPRLWTALEIIAREGDRIGTHGFALLWRDRSGFGLTKHNITICGISPFALFNASVMRGTVSTDDGRLVERLLSYAQDHDPSGHHDALMATAKVAYPLLEEIGHPTLEGLHTWNADYESLRHRAEPIMCEFWGALGEHARSLILSPAIRKHRRTAIRNGLGNWRDPSIGIPLIQSFTRPTIFFEGEVRCSDAFRLGVLYGLDRTYRLSLRTKPHPAVHARFLWNHIEHMAAWDEVMMLTNAAENVTGPEDGLRFREDPLVDDEADARKALDWLISEFFQDSDPHKLFLSIGLNGALLFDEQRQGLRGGKTPSEWLDAIEGNLRSAAAHVLAHYQQLERESGLDDDMSSTFKRLRNAYSLPESFKASHIGEIPAKTLLATWPLCLEASESVLKTVFHEHAPLALNIIDWTWLKQGVAEMRARGEADAGVILLPNGHFVTGPVMPIGFTINLKLDDPEKQVLFSNRSHGIGVVRPVAWEDLISGAAYGARETN